MWPFLLKRLLLAIPALWALATAVFLLSRMLPGTFASERLLQNNAPGYYSKGTEADKQAAYTLYMKRTGLDLPLFYLSVAPANGLPAAQNKLPAESSQIQDRQRSFAYLTPSVSWHGSQNQYHQWLVGALHGNLGESYRTSRPVTESLLEAIGNTFWLLLISMVLTFALALELSIQMIRKKGKWLRRALLPFLFITDSVPSFVLALLLLVFLANPDFLQLFPVYGMGYYTPDQLTAWQEMVQRAYYMALPMLCLVLFNLPYLTNQVYASLHTAMQADFARTARAKGLGESAVVRGHALRNALLPIITIVSDFIPALVTGTFIVETIFAVPGIGRMLIEAVLSRDYPVLTGIVLLIAAFRIVAFVMADIAYAWADPRIRQQTQ
ncbi:ABC transporter permease [Pontibacter sp. E15-1]|uniref:ABC transporter permease n=1 Tax=Pontibacter sp. E15-1 TaxID=2919918 RepID=UPI001F4F8DAC|nr:ABC transporter permease [Pontibacter sp. E15-1]MCJ8167433.1 ABC transporter permease [Pontibacter sp. E15-1]